MPTFNNNQRLPISARSRNQTIISNIDVSGLTTSVTKVEVTVQIEHTWDSDLTLVLVSPNGSQNRLISRRGGSGDDVRATFSDSASISINSGRAPFAGTFRPTESLTVHNSQDGNGRWQLRVTDHARLDGGALLGWTLNVETSAPPPPPSEDFPIEVNVISGISASQKLLFDTAALRWGAIIKGPNSPVRVNGEVIEGLKIDAVGTRIDGPGGVLGQAGPTLIRGGSSLPIRGSMQFDSADLDNFERNGQLFSIIIHEMGHVLGIGTLWSRLGLLVNRGSQNPTFVGSEATVEWRRLAVTAGVNPGSAGVPVANTGGPGSADSHWRESIFSRELMTPFLNRGDNPLALLTIASLDDMGYDVDTSFADAYSLPGSQFQTLIEGAGGIGDYNCNCGVRRLCDDGTIEFVEPEIHLKDS